MYHPLNFRVVWYSLIKNLGCNAVFVSYFVEIAWSSSFMVMWNGWEVRIVVWQSKVNIMFINSESLWSYKSSRICSIWFRGNIGACRRFFWCHKAMGLGRSKEYVKFIYSIALCYYIFFVFLNLNAMICFWCHVLLLLKRSGSWSYWTQI